MNSPNIFDYATSELSQDAFLCYMLAFGKENYKKDFPEEYTLAHKFLARCGIDENEEILSVDKQVDHVDVLIITTKHILIIEDKTYTNEHDDQIVRYVKNMRSNNKKFTSNKKIKVCYVKTGDYVNSYHSSDDTLSNEDCCSLRRHDLVELLKNCHQDKVIDMFYERLIKVENEISACDEKNIYTWTRPKWFDYLYNILKSKGKKFDIGEVSNAQGGFYACWLDWVNVGKIEQYKQIEIHFKEEKTDFVDLCLKVSSKDKETTRSYKDKMIDWQEKAIQNGFIRPNRWRIGRTTTYAYKVGKNTKDVENFIEKCIMG